MKKTMKKEQEQKLEKNIRKLEKGRHFISSMLHLYLFKIKLVSNMNIPTSSTLGYEKPHYWINYGLKQIKTKIRNCKLFRKHCKGEYFRKPISLSKSCTLGITSVNDPKNELYFFPITRKAATKNKIKGNTNLNFYNKCKIEE